MMTFPDYIKQRLTNSGYTVGRSNTSNNDLLAFTPDKKKVWICYLDQPIEPEQIRRAFAFDGYMLFVVKESLIPDEIVSRTETPMWLRVLHGLYMGRVYVWNDRYLFGLHFDYDTGDVSESGIIQPDELLLVETGTWLRGWTDVYRLARFYDRAWWTEGAGQYDQQYQRAKQSQSAEDFRKHYYGEWTPPENNQSSSRQSYEQARDSYWEQQRKREQSGHYGTGQYNTPPHYSSPPQQNSSKRDFMREFANAGSPSAVKALYRTLAKEFHPDLNPGMDTTAIMQEINKAYDRYR